jgi:uncharacterized protein
MLSKRIFRRIEEVHLEVTRRCNLQCIYCYASKDSANAPVMERATAAQFLKLVLQNTESQEITVCFHGGEPLLAPPELFEGIASDIASEAAIAGKRFRFAIQTNATLVDEARLKVIEKHHIAVASSLDGNFDLNSRTRGGSQAALKGILALKKRKALTGLMVIVTPQNASRLEDSLDFFAENQLNFVQINPVCRLGRVTNNQSLMLTKDQIFQFRKLVLDRMLAGTFPIDLGTLIILEKFLGKGNLSLLNCTNPFCHAGLLMVLLDARGDIYPCGLSAHSEAKLGRIDDLSEDGYWRVLEEFHAKDDTYRHTCKSCPASAICSFGCPAQGGITSAECQATRDFHAYLNTLDSRYLLAAYEQVTLALTALRHPFPFRHLTPPPVLITRR